MKLRLNKLLLCLAAAGVVVSGCARRSVDVRPAVSASPQFLESPDAPRSEAPLLAPWWQTFHDPVLASLIDRALDSNFELQQLAARIDQARAFLRQARGQLLPSLDGSADYESRWTDLDGADSDRQELTSAGGFLNWEVDLWGRLRSAKRARQFETEVAVHDWEGGRLLLSASVAETYFEILEQRLQRRLLEEQIEANQTLFDLTRLRFGQGQSSIVDVLQQREQLAATLALVPAIEARLEQLEYALDVLLGRASGDRDRVVIRELAAPPSLPATGVPSELLVNRPDLLAVRDLARAVDYRIAEAVADRLPRFAIGGSLSAVGDPGFSSLVGSAFASVAGPIYDAGIRKAEVDRRRAQLEEALAAYSQTFLTAVQEVETALVRERKQGDRVERIEDQLAIAQRLLLETRNRYSQGLTDYLPVLNAVVTTQELERQLLTSRRELLNFRVALHRALGGPMANTAGQRNDRAL